jgi:hypothetical protein
MGARGIEEEEEFPVEWNIETAIAFVELYKAKLVPWDPTLPRYGNKHTECVDWAYGIIWPIACFEFLKRYCRLVYESPVAKTLSVNCQSPFNWNSCSVYGILLRSFRTD